MTTGHYLVKRQLAQYEQHSTGCGNQCHSFALHRESFFLNFKSCEYFPIVVFTVLDLLPSVKLVERV